MQRGWMRGDLRMLDEMTFLRVKQRVMRRIACRTMCMQRDGPIRWLPEELASGIVLDGVL
eukprot:3241619-Rhodomonas_salina.1